LQEAQPARIGLQLRLTSSSQVLNDLLDQRGLTEWQVVQDVRSSTDCDESVDLIYGYALTASLQEERIDRKRKHRVGKPASGQEQPTWSCFLVLPAVSSSRAAPTLSIKWCAAVQDIRLAMCIVILTQS
jgi:hypothetical protein